MQDFITLLQHRRSTRKYTEEVIEQDAMDYLLRCALMSPSGHRANPWEFFATTDVAKIRPLSACRTYGSGMFDTAMGAIAVAVDASLTDVWQFDAAIAAYNLLLAAEERGLGACWCQVWGRFSPVKTDSEEPAENLVKRMLGIPEHLTVACVISLGYKNEERKPYDLERLPSEKIHKV